MGDPGSEFPGEEVMLPTEDMRDDVLPIDVLSCPGEADFLALTTMARS